MFKDVQSYKNALEMLNKVDAGLITFESASAGGMDLEAFGVIDHHSLQGRAVEHIRRAPKQIPAEHLVLSSDCGMGRRRHAYYKIVLLVGTNMVRKELGLPQAGCLAADGRYSLVVPAK
jgi:5-methyltetrahydropteroyltriglutamate--homocysteine methyltransferase